MPPDDTFTPNNSILTPTATPQAPVSRANTAAPSSAPPPIDSVVTTSSGEINNGKNTGFKKVVAILGVFLLMGGIGAGVFLVQQQQNVEEKAAVNFTPVCPIQSTDGRIIVTFNGISIRSDQTQAESINGPYTTNIPKGSYKVTLVSYDNHSDNTDQIQPREQWKVLLSSDSSTDAARTNAIADLPDNQDYLTEVVNSSFTVPFATTQIVAEHSSYPDKTSPNSIHPVCAVFEPISSESVAQCNQVKAFDNSWNPLSTVDLEALTEGDIIRFTVSGTASTGIFEKARFTINGEAKPETTVKREGTEEFYYEYTIPANVDSFSVKGEVYHSTLGWL